MTTVYLIRHAEAEGNVYRRCHGQYDSLLTEQGQKQLVYLAQRFADVPLDAVYASDLYRARHTAKAIADAKGQKVITHSALREIDMGEWEDKTWAVLAREYPQVFAQWQTRAWACQIPGGETIMQTGARVWNDICKLAQKWSGKSIAVVSHGTAIRGVLCRILGYPPEQIGEVGWGDNTCVTKFEITDAHITPIYWNDASHLPEELSTFANIGWTNRKGVPVAVQTWYRTYHPENREDRALLLQFARELYRNAYGSCAMLKEDVWMEETDRMVQKHPRAVTIGMVEEQPVALVRLNVCDERVPNTGMIGSLVLDDAYRGTGISGQMMGQAISVYRALGKEYLCALPTQSNLRAQAFYKKHGFIDCGQVETAEGIHRKMRKRIAVDPLQQEEQDFVSEA